MPSMSPHHHGNPPPSSPPPPPPPPPYTLDPVPQQVPILGGAKRRGGSFGDGPYAATAAVHGTAGGASPGFSAGSSVSPSTAPTDGPSASASASAGGGRGGGGGSDTSGTTAKRFQVPRACERCKRLRRGCSEYRPCRRCIDSGVADQCHTAASAAASHPGIIMISSQSDTHAVHQRLLELVPSRVIDYCTDRFFDRLHPTIPILTHEYVARLRSAITQPPETGLESLCVLVGMCGQVLLQTGEPEDLFHQGVIPDRNMAFGRVLLETAVSAWQAFPRRSAAVTIEMCLFTFFLYACEAVLFHHSRAFRFLRETTTLLLLYHLPEGADETTRLVANRLFWVLLISERSHAIRYRRPITLQITDDTPSLDSRDPSLVGFWSLAALFRPIDTSFIALLNHETLVLAPSPEGLNLVETRVNSALRPGLDLRDTQKANLRVTQLWLRVIIWQLRLHLGYLVEESYQHSLTFRYPIDVAKDLVLSTRDLPTSSFRVHGVGMTEKLFDIASALVDVLARIPLTSSSPRGVDMGSMPEDDLSYLRLLIQKLPGGNTIYDDLLEKHIQHTVPSLAARRLGV